MKSAGDWGEAIDEADADCFVGRKAELISFNYQIQQNPSHNLIFYITGQGGVGKTTLLNRYKEIAKDNEYTILDCNEKHRSIPAVLGRFSQQLDEQDISLKHFEERYKIYRQKIKEIENDPEAPQGLAAILGRTVVRATYVVGDLIPGVRKGLEYLPKEQLEAQGGEFATYLVKKFSNKDEMALVREPAPILTALFFKDLNDIVTEKGSMLLCFENFEVTRQELQDWFLSLREYKPSRNIRMVIASRDRPGAKWDVLKNITSLIYLDIFTEKEAEEFLDEYNITDPKRRREILECSCRLPVLMSWLSAPQGNEPDTSIPTHDIVDRFLRWVEEPALRDVALLASVPRTFNIDILRFLLVNRNIEINEFTAFNWLQTMPFVKQHQDGWRYHDVVRLMMLKYQRDISPKKYRQISAMLANFYDNICRNGEVSDVK